MTKQNSYFSHRFVIYLIILVGLVVYANALKNGFVGDDTYQVLHNPLVHSLNNIPQFFTGSTYFNGNPEVLVGVYYRPLMVTMYSILYSLNGPNPHLFHLSQILLHICNAVLVYFFLKKFFEPILSCLLAIIFLVHPQNNEAVVYIANLQDTLFLFFGLIGFLLLMYKPQKHFLIVSFFFLSLLSKESGILFIALGFVYAFFFQRKSIRDLTLWMMAMLLGYFILRVPIAHIGFSYSPVAPITLASSQERLLTIPAIVLFYLQTFFFPLHMSALHFWIVKTPGMYTFYLPLMSLISILALLFWFGTTLARRNKKHAQVFVFFCSWVLVGIVLHLHLITALDATTADRWFYFSFIGMLGIIGVFSETLIRKSLRIKRGALFLAVLIIIGLCTRTIIRNADWYNTLTLYEHDLPQSSSNFLSNNALGTEYLAIGEYAKAKPLITASVTEYPYFANLNNAAVIALHEKDIAKAKRYLQAALRQSDNYQIYENYSNFLVKYGTKHEAKEFTEKALRKFPHSQKLIRNKKLLQQR